MAAHPCAAGSLRVSDSAGTCVCSSGTIDVAGSCILAAEFFGAAAGVLAGALILAWLAAHRRARNAGERGEDGEFRARVEALRNRLGLTPQHGFLLTTDRIPLWRQAAAAAKFVRERGCGTVCVDGGGGDGGGDDEEVVYVQRSQLEAAARLWLLREDADAKLARIRARDRGSPSYREILPLWQYCREHVYAFNIRQHKHAQIHKHLRALFEAFICHSVSLSSCVVARAVLYHCLPVSLYVLSSETPV